MKACATLGIAHVFTSYNNPNGNVDTARLMRTLKEQLVWLRESSPRETAVGMNFSIATGGRFISPSLECQMTL